MIFIAHFLLSIILFIKCGYPLLVNDINNITHEKQKIHKQNRQSIKNQMILPVRRNTKKDRKNKNKNFGKRKNNFPPKKYKLNFINNMNLSKRKSNKASSAIKLNTINSNNNKGLNLNQNKIMNTTNKAGKKKKIYSK